MLPDRAVWQARDVFLDEDDTLTRVGGTLAALSAGSVISGADQMILDSNELDNVLRGVIYDESGGAAAPVKTAAYTPGAGAFAASAVLSSVNAGWVTATGGGRPARYFNRILRPNGIPASLPGAHSYLPYSIFGGGAHVQTVRTSASVIVAIAGDNLLTGLIAADTAAVEVGNIIRVANATVNYTGRIVEVTSATTLRVSPTPSVAIAASTSWAAASVAQPVLKTAGKTWICGVRALTVWGDRVILGGVAYDLLNAGTKLEVRGNRLAWSILPAVDSAVVGAFTYDGMREGGVESFLVGNFSDIMGMETILGLEPVNQGELLVLGYPRIFRVVGYFSTITTQAGGGNTWDVRPVQDAVACISDAATATTPSGIMFAAFDGIYLYRGGRAINSMMGRIARQWQDSIRAGAIVTGGGYLGRLHYAVFTTAGGFLCDLTGDGFRWSELTLSNMGQVALDPARPGSGYLIRKAPGVAALTNKLVRSESMLEPAAANKTDAVTGGPTPQIVTRSYTEGDPGRLRLWRKVEMTLRLVTAGTATITAIGGLDAEQTSVVLGTFTAAAGNQMKRFDIQTAVPLISKGLTLQITVTGNPDEFELVSVKIDSIALNEQRVA